MTAPFATPHTDGAASAAFIEKRPLEQYLAPDKPWLVGLRAAPLAAALGTIGIPSGSGAYVSDRFRIRSTCAARKILTR